MTCLQDESRGIERHARQPIALTCEHCDALWWWWPGGVAFAGSEPSLNLRSASSCQHCETATMEDLCVTSRVCTSNKAGWQCLLEPGHDGPHAAAPLYGRGACPHIDLCIQVGCQSKCGPGTPMDGDDVYASPPFLVQLISDIWSLIRRKRA